MCPYLEFFTSISTLSTFIPIKFPDGSLTCVSQIGSVPLTSQIILNNVLYVPSFKHNLLSVGSLLDSTHLVAHFTKSHCLLQDPTTKQTKASGRRVVGLYQFCSSYSFSYYNHSNPISSTQCVNVVSVSVSSSSLLHARLGHVSPSIMRHLSSTLLDNKSNTVFHFEACLLGKHHKLPFSLSSSHALHSFDLVHIDLWGPYRTPSLSGATYFLTILDDYSRTTWTDLLHNKTQVHPVVSAFIAYVHNHFNKTIKVIRSDNGTEIVQESCSTLFGIKGIIHKKSLPGVPQQNGRVERKHKHLLEIARTIRFHAHLPIKFWGDCLLSATYLINLLPSSVLNWKTPYEMLMGKPPEYQHLRVIGCLCYPVVKSSDKFAPRAAKCILLGYPFAPKG
ncbi:Retrovirus-related Pol polyprotein from transposon RE1 [Bienertia sinuspersici]